MHSRDEDVDRKGGGTCARGEGRSLPTGGGRLDAAHGGGEVVVQVRERVLLGPAKENVLITRPA